jgi:uncharacterized protein (UPF0548 family)
MSYEEIGFLLSVTIPAVGWAITIHLVLIAVRRQVDRLVAMHEDPDRYGFGTSRTNELITNEVEDHHQLIRENTQAVKALTHYVRWLATHQTGKEPPPPTVDI